MDDGGGVQLGFWEGCPHGSANGGRRPAPAQAISAIIAFLVCRTPPDLPIRPCRDQRATPHLSQPLLRWVLAWLWHHQAVRLHVPLPIPLLLAWRAAGVPAAGPMPLALLQQGLARAAPSLAQRRSAACSLDGALTLAHRAQSALGELAAASLSAAALRQVPGLGCSCCGRVHPGLVGCSSKQMP